MQRCVPVLIYCIDVCFELHQLGTGDSPCEPGTVPVSPGKIPMSPAQPPSSLCLVLGDAGVAQRAVVRGLMWGSERFGAGSSGALGGDGCS